MDKIRTYGVTKEVLGRVSDAIYMSLMEMAGSAKPSKEIEEIMEVLLTKPLTARALIVSSLIYGIGNFDRIEKVELNTELGEDGLLKNPTVVRPDYIQ